jgi:hypothetical protein
MPNRFTRIPDAPVPPPGPLGSAVLPVADFFMLAMFSRPATGSLRTTWVTPSTYWMTVVVSIGALVIGVLLLSGLIGAVTSLSLIGVVVCLFFVIGAGAVALIGREQRRSL